MSLGQLRHAQLIGHDPRAHLFHCALRQRAEPERAEGDADQPVHLEPQLRQGAPDLAVLALAQADGQPCIRALLTVERHLHRLVTDTLHLDALPQRLKICLGRRALDPHAVLAQPTRAGQLQLPFDPAVIGEEQQAFGSQVQPPDTHDPRHRVRERIEDRLAPLLVGGRRHKARRLVV
jgi:hypothetical protein